MVDLALSANQLTLIIYLHISTQICEHETSIRAAESGQSGVSAAKPLQDTPLTENSEAYLDIRAQLPLYLTNDVSEMPNLRHSIRRLCVNANQRQLLCRHLTLHHGNISRR